jgi:hypothetical protein
LTGRKGAQFRFSKLHPFRFRSIFAHSIVLNKQAEARFLIAATHSSSSSSSSTAETTPLQLLFLYYCPADAPARQKMGYSVQKKAVVKQVETLVERPLTAVLEVQELADVASALVAAAASADQTAPAAALENGGGDGDGSAPGGAATAIVRPRAPGRRASTRVKTLLTKDDDDDED